ncbi:putative peptide modification system cyclase [Marilutibacter chinensis]
MDDVVTLEQEPQAATAAPQLRTILLTDICDSTTLVEQLGDSGTAQFFREHDRLVLRLQQQWRGRLIDRSDGLLLLFERPIDGLGFALDYGRGLDEIGKLRHLKVRTRAGLHVGEVLTWRNSDEAVRLGAKPVEVEGLAKPIAARLMSIARPGQVLMSAVAEPLAHRAARELGERGQHMIWKSHGVWQFKGVVERQQIFEVGEPGVAPLRAPPNSPKAWRDIPLWRRPAMLAAEAALVAAVTVGGWFATRPPPAIAFNERDWVVVGDLRNLTGDTRLDDSLEQAFRISLEQSRFVNVLSDLKVRDSLARMRLDPETLVDRGLAAQIAQRDGARAVIVPTVSEVGGRLRFSVEVIDPYTQTTVYAHVADGKGEESVLASIDQVTGALRADLGEAVVQIDKDSRPLPEVTTGNLDALRAYALAQEAYANHRFTESLQLYRRATQLDPEFALAWIGQVRSHYAVENAPAAVEPMRKAQTLRKHLPSREAMYLDAWAAKFDDPATTASKWVELARLYPDFMPAQGNAATWLYKDNQFKAALEHALAAAVPQNPLAGQEFDSVGRAQLGLERYAEAEAAFRRSNEMTGSSMRRLVSTAAARGDLEAAARYAKSLDPANAYSYIEQTSLAVDRSDWTAAREASRQALATLDNPDGLAGRYLRLPVAVVDMLAGDRKAAARQAGRTADIAIQALEAAGGFNADAEEDAALALASALVALRSGDRDVAKRVIAALDEHDALMRTPALSELRVVLRAAVDRRNGRAREAVTALEPLLVGGERYQTRVELMEAYARDGRLEEAVEQARWLQRRRGLAYVELECGHCLQALNVADSRLAVRREAQLLEELGRSKDAQARKDAFGSVWPGFDEKAYLRR